MERKENIPWLRRIEKWLRPKKRTRPNRVSAGDGAVPLLVLLFLGQAFLFPQKTLAGGATWSSRSADVSSVASAAQRRYSHSRSMRQIMAADQRGHQLRQNLRAARDSEMATALGWAFFDGRYFVAADEWFGLAQKWNPQNAAAAEGLVVAAYRSGDVGNAYGYAVKHANLVPYAREVVGRGLEQRAQSLAAAGRTREADRLRRELGCGTARRMSFVRPRLPFGRKGRTTAAPAPTPSSQPSGVTEAQVKSAIAEGRHFRARSLARRAGVSGEQLAAWTLADYSGKVVAYQRAGDYRSALRTYSRAVRMGVPSFDARKANALSLYQMGEYRDAAEAFTFLAKERNDREVATGLRNSLSQLETAGGVRSRSGRSAGIGKLIENCPLVLLFKRIGEAVRR